MNHRNTHAAAPRAAKISGRNAALAERFGDIRRATLALAAPLSAEDCALQSMPDASPVKWHLGHSSWFFETFILEQYLPQYAPFHPAFRKLFNSYYHLVGDRHPRPERGLLSRPDLATVYAYRTHVDKAMNQLFGETLPAECSDLIELGVQHEQQHQELILTDVKHLLARNPLQPAYHPRWPLATIAPRPLRFFRFDGGLVTVGHEGAGFAFDNESPAHPVYVAPFELGSRPVTNGEFAHFIADGGYRRPELWLSLGWDTRCAQAWEAPMYWEPAGGNAAFDAHADSVGANAGNAGKSAGSVAWTTFTLHGRVEIDPHTPVCHLSYFEADAYARWAGARLPTEFEWEIAARNVSVRGNFQETSALHPLPATGHADPATPVQMFGDVWEALGNVHDSDASSPPPTVGSGGGYDDRPER